MRSPTILRERSRRDAARNRAGQREHAGQVRQPDRRAMPSYHTHAHLRQSERGDSYYASPCPATHAPSAVARVALPVGVRESGLPGACGSCSRVIANCGHLRQLTAIRTYTTTRMEQRSFSRETTVGLAQPVLADRRVGAHLLQPLQRDRRTSIPLRQPCDLFGERFHLTRRVRAHEPPHRQRFRARSFSAAPAPARLIATRSWNRSCSTNSGPPRPIQHQELVDCCVARKVRGQAGARDRGHRRQDWAACEPGKSVGRLRAGHRSAYRTGVIFQGVPAANTSWKPEARGWPIRNA